MTLPAGFLSALATDAPELDLWLEIEGLPYAFGLKAHDASFFTGRAEKYRRLAGKALLADLPSGVESEVNPIEGDLTIGSLTMEIVDEDGTSAVLDLVANAARTDNLLAMQAPRWQAYAVYDVGAVVRPTATGAYGAGIGVTFVCTTQGMAGENEPTWSLTGETVTGQAHFMPSAPLDLDAGSADIATLPYSGTADNAVYPTTGGVFYIGRETFKYTSRSAAGYFYGVKRQWYALDGRLKGYAHTAGDLISPYPRFLATRHAAIYACMNGVEQDKVARYVGVVRRARMARELSTVLLDIETLAAELKVEAFGAQRRGRLLRGVMDSAGGYEKDEDEVFDATSSVLAVDPNSLNGAPYPLGLPAASTVVRTGGEYFGVRLINEATTYPELRGQMNFDWAPSDRRGALSSRPGQHKPGDDVFEVLLPQGKFAWGPVGIGGGWKVDLEIAGNGTVATLTPMFCHSLGEFAGMLAGALTAASANITWSDQTPAGSDRIKLRATVTGTPGTYAVKLKGTGANKTNRALEIAGIPFGSDIVFSVTTTYDVTLLRGSGWWITEEPAHPLDVALNLLNTRDGDGALGAHDVLLPGTGAGIEEGRLDVAGITALKQKWLPAELHFEAIEDKFLVKQKVAEILKPLGCYLVPLLNDKLTIKRRNPPTPDAVPRALTPTQVLELPSWDTEPENVVGRIVLKADYDPASEGGGAGEGSDLGGFRQRYTMDILGPGTEAQEFYPGIYKTLTVEAKGQWSGNQIQAGGRLGPQVGTAPDEVARRYREIITARHSKPWPMLGVVCAYDALDVEIGDPVTLTLDHLPNVSSGARGFAAVICEVVGKTPNDDRGTVEFTVMQTPFSVQGRLIAPSAILTADSAYNATSITCSVHEFTDPAGSAVDASCFMSGDWIQIWDPTLTTEKVLTRIISIAGNVLNLNGGIYAAVSTGDVVLLAPYDSALTTRKKRTAYLARTDGTLEDSGVFDPAHTFVS